MEHASPAASFGNDARADMVPKHEKKGQIYLYFNFGDS
jgi:hypothetical protein